MKNLLKKWLGYQDIDDKLNFFYKNYLRKDEFDSRIDALFIKKYNRPYFASIFKKTIESTNEKTKDTQ